MKVEELLEDKHKRLSRECPHCRREISIYAVGFTAAEVEQRFAQGVQDCAASNGRAHGSA